MTRMRLNIAMATITAIGGLALATPAPVSALLMASCKTTVKYPDGREVTTVIEGDKCTLDMRNGTCTCE